MVKIIDGTSIAAEIKAELKAQLSKSYPRNPKLVVIQVGNNPASTIYIQNKIKACHEVGIESLKIHLDESCSDHELLKTIQECNQDAFIDGILVQLPLPKHIDPSLVNSAIDPTKDVDGFHPFNLGKLLLGEQEGFLPCTPLGIRTLLERSEISIPGKHVVVVGRSNIVGKPIAAMLMQNNSQANATVSLVHSKTPQDVLKILCKSADILIVAIGKPLFITAEFVKEGAVIIDVGINKNEQTKITKKIVGDVDFENVKDKCSAITPVPKGVGPMTIAMLLSNTVKSFLSRFP